MIALPVPPLTTMSSFELVQLNRQTYPVIFFDPLGINIESPPVIAAKAVL